MPTDVNLRQRLRRRSQKNQEQLVRTACGASAGNSCAKTFTAFTMVCAWMSAAGRASALIDFGRLPRSFVWDFSSSCSSHLSSTPSWVKSKMCQGARRRRRGPPEGRSRTMLSASPDVGSKRVGPDAEPPSELPFASSYHTPVVCREVVEWLITDVEGLYVDGTLGGGGHSAALLSALGPNGRVVGLDRDPEALAEASSRLSAEAEAGRFTAVKTNFAEAWHALQACPLVLQPLLCQDAVSPAMGWDRASFAPPLGAMRTSPQSSTPKTHSKSDASSGQEGGMCSGDAQGAGTAVGAGARAGEAPRKGFVDGLLLDLGVSSRQIDDGQRGFSFSVDGPLDMRMEAGPGHGARHMAGEELGVGGKGAGEGVGSDEEGTLGSRGGVRCGGPLSAADVINWADERDIREIVWRYGDERRSTKIARAIVENRPINTTGRLAEVVGACAPFKERTKTLARVFQALRIKVNGELDALETILEQAKELIRPGGRVVILSYHSLEDRRVKRVLATGNLEVHATYSCALSTLTALSPWKPLTRKPLQASEAEVALNPRARSVRMRVAERTGHP
ncbi:unnamed protein product [Discosporangium mesarthrocarpum]